MATPLSDCARLFGVAWLLDRRACAAWRPPPPVRWTTRPISPKFRNCLARPMPAVALRIVPCVHRRRAAAAFNTHSLGGGGSGLAQPVFHSPARISATESGGPCPGAAFAPTKSGDTAFNMNATGRYRRGASCYIADSYDISSSMMLIYRLIGGTRTMALSI